MVVSSCPGRGQDTLVEGRAPWRPGGLCGSLREEPAGWDRSEARVVPFVF